MFRCLLSLFVLMFFSSVNPPKANSEFRFNDGSKIEVQWYEKAGTILTDDVCFNYKEDKRKYKQCRKKALDYFKEECEFYTDKIRNTSKKYRHMYVPEMEKFCNAHSTYEP